MADLLINLLARVIADSAVWLAGFLHRRRKLGRERAFFGLSASASCLLVASRHASSPRESSVHRRDVAAKVELATIARGCGAHADRVGEHQPAGEIGRLTEFWVGGPSAGSNLAGARCLAAHHCELDRKFGAGLPFASGLRIVGTGRVRH